MKNKLLLILFLLSFHLVIGQQSYYNGLDFTKTGNELKNDLITLITNTHTSQLLYSDRHDYLYDADADSNNSSNVILIYSGESRDEREYISGSNSHSPQTFNTEHVYPQSDLQNNLTNVVYTIARADLHHLRSCDSGINTSRGNLDFVSGNGSYGPTNGGWYPGDDWKGDVARMILYLNLRYNLTETSVSNLSLLLQWNAEDPVDDFEDQRNQIIETAQGNRNPFIDNPHLATKIWGGPSAEDRWGILSNPNFSLFNVSIGPNPAKDVLNIKSTVTLNAYSIYNVLGKEVLRGIINNNQIDISQLHKGIYILKIINNSGLIKSVKFLK